MKRSTILSAVLAATTAFATPVFANGNGQQVAQTSKPPSEPPKPTPTPSQQQQTQNQQQTQSQQQTQQQQTQQNTQVQTGPVTSTGGNSNATGGNASTGPVTSTGGNATGGTGVAVAQGGGGGSANAQGGSVEGSGNSTIKDSGNSTNTLNSGNQGNAASNVNIDDHSSFKAGAITGAPAMGSMVVLTQCGEAWQFTIGGGTPFGGSGGAGAGKADNSGTPFKNGFTILDYHKATPADRAKMTEGFGTDMLADLDCNYRNFLQTESAAARQQEMQKDANAATVQIEQIKAATASDVARVGAAAELAKPGVTSICGEKGDAAECKTTTKSLLEIITKPATPATTPTAPVRTPGGMD